MKYAIAPSNAGRFGDPRAAAELARTAEEAGWDGYFIWDALPVGPDSPPAYDPWVTLGAIATVTEVMRIGTCIAVVPRYRPQLLARTLATLDVLSNGRMIFGVGLGDGPGSFDAFGEDGAALSRAEKLDEALEIITRLWSGEEVNHRGDHFVVEGFSLTATPAQRPRIPIWVGGDSRGALRRAARWDGWIGPSENPMAASLEDAVGTIGRLRENGAQKDSFDVAWAGMAQGNESGRVVPYGEAGATWWIEMMGGSREEVLARVASGPPRPDVP